jgi:hypothetical protein
MGAFITVELKLLNRGPLAHPDVPAALQFGASSQKSNFAQVLIGEAFFAFVSAGEGTVKVVSGRITRVGVIPLLPACSTLCGGRSNVTAYR